jgi:hypothetical protein
MSSLFTKLTKEAFAAGINPRTKESREWFTERVKTLRAGKIDRRKLMRDELLTMTNRERIGQMLMFFYDPKTKETLPYYDRFPLIVVVGPAEGGFYGLNLHYLPPVLRAKMLDGLLDATTNSRFDDTTRFKIKYATLQRMSKMRWYKPCFKHYLDAHVQSRFALVNANEWEVATFLPTASFKGATVNQVYRESRRKI